MLILLAFQAGHDNPLYNVAKEPQSPVLELNLGSTPIITIGIETGVK